MKTTIILYNHIQSLEKELVKFGNHPLYNAINIKNLTSNLKNFDTIDEFFKSKNVTDHLRKNIIKAMLCTNPPEEVKVELLIFML